MRPKLLTLIGSILLMAVSVLSACSGSTAVQTTAQTASVAQKAPLSPITLVQEPVSGSFSRLADLSATVALPEAGSAMVYKVKPPTVDASAAQSLADKLGLGAGDVGDAGDYLFIRGTAGTLSVDRISGAIFYDTPQLEGTGRPLKDVRDDSYYRAEAEKFLKANGLWREGAVYIGVSKETMVATNSQGKDESYPLSVEVLFGSQGLGGFKWVGVGPKISVFFGEGAQLTGAAIYWPEVEPYKEYPTISGQQAMENVMSGKGSIVMSEPNEQTGVVEQVELVYWCDPIGYPQKFVAPYYKMKGVTADGSAFTAYTRALPQELITETSPPSPAHPVVPTPREDERR